MSNFHYTERRKEELGMSLSLELDCGVLGKSFRSFDNNQIIAMPTILKHQEMLSIKNLA